MNARPVYDRMNPALMPLETHRRGDETDLQNDYPQDTEPNGVKPQGFNDGEKDGNGQDHDRITIHDTAASNGDKDVGCKKQDSGQSRVACLPPYPSVQG